MRFLIVLLIISSAAIAQPPQNNPGSNHANRFEQLGYLLQSPNEYRTASGAPGPKYWQQRADYDISAELDEAKLLLKGSETITYYNNSPDQLTYLWLQLDGNIHDPLSDNLYTNRSRMENQMTNNQLERLELWRKAKEQDLGVKINRVTDAQGNMLKYTLNKTMMRVDLPSALKPGQQYILQINWQYKIPDRNFWGSRGGYELFPEDGNAVFTMSQFYPRMAVYSDFQGWQNTQFSGGAEFALTFGNFKVRLTVPDDFVVAATGECKNYKQLLSPAQYQRWLNAQKSKEVTEVVTKDEAIDNEKEKASGKKTWIYEAINVRDFAWGASRKFIWDAMPTDVEGKKVMCMSYYPKEAYSLYRKYSTKVTAHTLKVYSKHTIPYPYPVAISVEASQGMEYPMISFNYGRTEKDGTYSEATKYGMIGVIIHEVGHNFFPMIINSDERQYWWMDEGLNTFTQFLTEEEFDNNYPSKRGPAHLITDYMKLPKDQLEPIMTMGENVVNVGANAYSKAATGLNILRETVMGRELFDYSYREYARRWAFKHPTPADLFRTMEDASGVDLDWFWRGWYYGTEPVDISLDTVKWYKVNAPENANALAVQEFIPIQKIRNKEDKSIEYATDIDTTLRDYYYYNRNADQKWAQKQRENALQKDDANSAKWVNKQFYELTFSNKGGMVMPVIIEWTYKDGTKEVDKIPAGIWRVNEKQFTKVFVKEKEVASIRLDPMKETADIDETNQQWPVKEMPTRFQLFKQAQGTGARGQSTGGNSMQRVQNGNQ
ncbi:MAG: M1 family metallopeptidase [Bacteroidota bacterium]